MKSYKVEAMLYKLIQKILKALKLKIGNKMFNSIVNSKEFIAKYKVTKATSNRCTIELESDFVNNSEYVVYTDMYDEIFKLFSDGKYGVDVFILSAENMSKGYEKGYYFNDDGSIISNEKLIHT